MASATDSISVNDLLHQARAKLVRLTPGQARAAGERGAVLVDIRPHEQRQRDGLIPGARIIPRNVLEWRLDPRSAYKDAEAARTDCPVIVICDQGYQSSLAAATLRSFGLDATDVIGGMQAWRRYGMPTEQAAQDHVLKWA